MKTSDALSEQVAPPSQDDIEVRVLVSLWIGPTLFQAGERTRMIRSDAEALNNGSPCVEIL